MQSNFKIFSDPVHGFISVPRERILDLIQAPEVQRLRRIRQLGVGYLVFPGAEHTRFGHALGAMALMQDALNTLAEKGTPISPEESLAAQAVALLHDLGHGPFSHTLEHTLIRSFEHEEMSRALLGDLNQRFNGALDLAVQIFDNTYHRPFFHQLISSQLDMDRLDYLRRDSFFTGVVEGEVGVQRIIKTLRVHPIEGGADSQIALEAKGIYAVENFLISRRLMYWQVYLHKTVLAGDQLLRAIFSRARYGLKHHFPGIREKGAPALIYFLDHDVTGQDVADPEVRRVFCDLDDTDVLFSLKQWTAVDDAVLSDLCRRFTNRDFVRVTFLPQDPTPDDVNAWRRKIEAWLVTTGRSTPDHARHDATFYLTLDHSRHRVYGRKEEPICVVDREGRLNELTQTPEGRAVDALAIHVVKPFVSYPKEVDLFAA